MIRSFTIILLTGVAVMLLGCGIFDVGQKVARSDDEVSAAPSPVVSKSAPSVAPSSPNYLAPSSLESRILASPVIARVRLDSATSTVEYGTTYRGMKYIALLEFSFSVLEYLKGSGANEIVGVWAAAPFFDTRQEAEAALPAIAAARDIRWDDHEAIVFLRQDFREFLASTQQSERYYLAWGGRWTIPDDGYSIASIHNRLWLPAEASVGSSSRPGGDQQRFLTEVPPAMGTAPTTTLGDVKARVTAVAAKIDAGDGSEKYRECVQRTYLLMGIDRYRIERGDDGFFHRIPDQELNSGLAASSVVYEQLDLGGLPDLRDKLWLDGENADLFGVESGDAVPYDFSGDGVNDTIQYAQRVVSVRPIPEGVYRVNLNHRDVHFVRCDGYTMRYVWTVTVTAPVDALHEFFFDPVTVASAVAADASNGVLKPATVESISYEPLSPGSEPAPGLNRGQAGKVKVKIVPWDTLSGVLDVIELDGTVSASLRVANSSVDLGSNTFTWSVPSQPWHDGDMLMVRIRRSAPFASAPHGLMSTTVGRDSISLSWDSVNGVTGYVVERRVSGDPGWETLDTEVTEKSYTASGLSCGTSYEFRVGAYGDGTQYERVPGPVPYATLSETTEECSAQGSPAAERH